MMKRSLAAEVASGDTGAPATSAPTPLHDGLAGESVVGLTMLATGTDGDACTDAYCAFPVAGTAEAPPDLSS